jgi:hypothetical protein
VAGVDPAGGKEGVGRSVHEIRPSASVDVHVNEAGDEQIPMQVNDGIALFGGDVRREGGDHGAADGGVHPAEARGQQHRAAREQEAVHFRVPSSTRSLQAKILLLQERLLSRTASSFSFIDSPPSIQQQLWLI